MPEFFNEHSGAVLSTTFDKYCYVNVRHLPRFFDYRNELVYSKIERVDDPADFEHPAVRNAMSMLDMHELRITYEGDLPARTGLGTSSSFAVGMLNAFHALKGVYASKEQLSREAIYLERILCAETGGWQDQIAASFGGLNKIEFSNDNFEVHPIIINPERKHMLDDNLLLFFTGFTRASAEVQEVNRIAEKSDQLEEMLLLVREAERVLVDSAMPLRRFGELLDETWKLKRGIGKKVSTCFIDKLYEKGIRAGAVGGKLLGAGGGGFLLFYVEPDAKESVREALKELLFIPFHFENGGTSIVHYTPEDYVSSEDER